VLTQLALDVGGSIAFEPTEIGRPSAGSVSIHDPGGTSLSTPSVTIDSVNTTLGSAAAAGSSQLTVASGTGITARRRYLLTDADGERDWVHVRAVSGTTVTLFDPLENSFASGATFQGCRLSATVASASCDELGEGYEARWVYTIGGVQYKAQTRFDVVRSVWPALLGSTQGLRAYARGLLTPAREGGRGLAFLEELEAASQQVRRDIRARGRDPSRFRSFDAFEEVVYDQVLVRLASTGDIVPRDWTAESWLQERRNCYDTNLAVAMQVTRDYDENQDGVTTTAERNARPDVVRILL
jgi:hypothetical protein